jgi:type II secretory pathway pseudopilin PulG
VPVGLVPGVSSSPVQRPVHSQRELGLTIVELLLVLAVLATIVGLAIPATRDTVDELRTAMAARYVAGRLMAARIDAVKRSTSVALRFEPLSDDYRFTSYLDGNANGVRSTEIAAGIDTPLGGSEMLRHKFPGVRFGLIETIPDADGVGGTGADGVRIGSARIETLSPDGTATAGTLYVRGRLSQYAVRVLGTTGRVRVLQYRQGGRVWVAR